MASRTKTAIDSRRKSAKEGRKNVPLPSSGKPIHMIFIQKLIWIAIAAVLGVGFIAGLYYLILQQDWHNIFTFLPKNTSLKSWWDGGMGIVHTKDWDIWRHGLRDKAEPEMWAIVGGILLGSSRSTRVIKPLFIAIGGLVMLGLVILGALFITWFTYFGPAKHLPVQTQNIVGIVMGLVVGHALHFLWMPMANSIRYQLVARSIHHGSAVPVWVSLPIAPPGWRTTYARLKAQDTAHPETAQQRAQKVNRVHQSKLFVPLGALLFLVIAVVGLLAKYVIAHGAHVPLLNP